jgi:hypothetical protein
VDTGFRKRSCFNNKIERDDDSKKSHRALVERSRLCGRASPRDGKPLRQPGSRPGGRVAGRPPPSSGDGLDLRPAKGPSDFLPQPFRFGSNRRPVEGDLAKGCEQRPSGDFKHAGGGNEHSRERDGAPHSSQRFDRQQHLSVPVPFGPICHKAFAVQLSQRRAFEFQSNQTFQKPVTIFKPWRDGRSRSAFRRAKREVGAMRSPRPLLPRLMK